MTRSHQGASQRRVAEAAAPTSVPRGIDSIDRRKGKRSQELPEIISPAQELPKRRARGRPEKAEAPASVPRGRTGRRRRRQAATDADDQEKIVAGGSLHKFYLKMRLEIQKAYPPLDEYQVAIMISEMWSTLSLAQRAEFDYPEIESPPKQWKRLRRASYKEDDVAAEGLPEIISPAQELPKRRARGRPEKAEAPASVPRGRTGRRRRRQGATDADDQEKNSSRRFFTQVLP